VFFAVDPLTDQVRAPGIADCWQASKRYPDWRKRPPAAL
jgi:hypothetical protein